VITQKLIHQSIQNIEYAKQRKERRQRQIEYEEWKDKRDASYCDFVLNPIECIEADMGRRLKIENWLVYTKAKFIAAVNSRDTELIFKACTKRGLKDLRDVCLSRLSKEEQKKFRLEAQDNCNWRGWVHKVTKDELVKSLMEIRRCLISKTDVWKNNYIL
tara:strand:+ start:19 stop:498 length:480 start_codon:yes stop_codon:yes gene_type:complete